MSMPSLPSLTGGQIGPDAAPVHLECFLCTVCLFDVLLSELFIRVYVLLSHLQLCPHSAKAFPEIKKIVSEYNGRVQARVCLCCSGIPVLRPRLYPGQPLDPALARARRAALQGRRGYW